MRVNEIEDIIDNDSKLKKEELETLKRNNKFLKYKVKRYKKHIYILETVLFLLGIIAIVIQNKNSLFQISGLILFLGLFLFIIYELFDIYSRDNIYFDEYNYSIYYNNDEETIKNVLKKNL